MPSTRFDLHDHDRVAISSNDVDFSQAAAPAALEDLVASLFQLFSGESFAALAQIAPGTPIVTPSTD